MDAVTAALNGNLEEVKRLLVSKTSYGFDGFIAHNGVRLTPLNSACLGDHYDVVKYLLDLGADIEGVSCDTFTRPLISACCMGCDRTVALLLQHNANPNSTDINGTTPLAAVAKCRHKDCPEIVSMLFFAGADLNTRAGEYDNETAMHLAARVGNFHVVDCLATLGAKIEGMAGSNQTPLEAAVYNERFDVAHLLATKYKAYVSKKIAMLVLFRTVRKEIASDVLDVCFAQHEPKQSTMDALLYQALTTYTYNVTIAKLLLKKGADPKAYISPGRSAFLLSMSNEDLAETFKLFTKRGCLVTEEDLEAFEEGYHPSTKEYDFYKDLAARQKRRLQESFETAALGWRVCDEEKCSLALLNVFNLQDIMKVSQF